MKGKVFYKSAQRQQRGWQRDLEKQAFFRYFRGPELWADENLWRQYQEWRRMRREEEFNAFKEEFLRIREQINKQLEEWPNPFKNGKKGEIYSLSIQLPSYVKSYKFKGLEKLNLEITRDPFDENKCHITGVPSEAGEFDIEFGCLWQWGDKYNHLSSIEKFFNRKFKLNVNPDPRELWKNIPTASDLEYYKPDEDSELIGCGPWNLLGASQRGRSHAHNGLPRDDDFGLGCTDGWAILMVADGAGSAPFSRKGSAMASEIAINECKKQLSANPELENIFANISVGDRTWLPKARKLAYSILAHAAFEVHKAIRQEAQSLGRNPKSYATTFLLAAAKRFPSGWIVMSFQIGDGAMAIIEGRGFSLRPSLLAEPDEGEFGGQTRFVTMKEMFEPQILLERVHIDLVQDLQGLLLMTDGVSDARFGTMENLREPRLWRELWFELAELSVGENREEKMLDWLNFWSKGNHDDRTVAMMFKKEILSLDQAPVISSLIIQKKYE